ncbi:MAG: hypothetical protein K2M30_04855, partial [Desulfovibrionaceae bacterium]|nr:hypothetical protein [Desulfovibrionaceae bacterium]
VMERIEDKCSAFVKHCIAAYSYKKQSLENERQLVGIISELVSLVNEIEEQSSTKSSYLSHEVHEIIEDIHYINTYKNAQEIPLQQIVNDLASLARVIEKGQQRNAKHIATEVRTIVENINLLNACSNSSIVLSQRKPVSTVQVEGRDELCEQTDDFGGEEGMKSILSTQEEDHIEAREEIQDSTELKEVSEEESIQPSLLCRGEGKEIIELVANRVVSTTYSDIMVNAIIDVSTRLQKHLNAMSKESVTKEPALIDTFEDAYDEPSGTIEISSMNIESVEEQTQHEIEEASDEIRENEEAKIVVQSEPSTLQESKEEAEYVLCLSDTETLRRFLPKNTVFDAIPIKEANLSVLCTPLLAATHWEYIDENIATHDLYKDLSDMIEGIRQRKGSLDWILE